MSEEQIYMAPKMFELLRFEGSTVVWTAGVVVGVVWVGGVGGGQVFFQYIFHIGIASLVHMLSFYDFFFYQNPLLL